MILGAHHAGIYCKNIEESLEFYQKLGGKLLFRSDAMEGDKPLRMAWVKLGEDAIFELLEQSDTSVIEGARITPNHIALRTNNMDAMVALLEENNIPIEAGPFDPDLPFDRPLEPEDAAVIAAHGDAGAKLRIMFFRGPSFERFEVVQDNLGAL